MNRIRLLLLILTAIAPLRAFAVGAIAVDDDGSDEPAYGVATGEDTKEAAQKAALKYCKEYDGENCRVVMWFEKCGAYAASKKYYGYGYGATKAVAVSKALEMCGKNSCKVTVAECDDESAPAAAATKPVVEAIVAQDADTPPSTTLRADLPKFSSFFRSEGTKRGDKFRGVWIAEDVGSAAPKETKIDEVTLAADRDNFYGVFSLSKPNNGWPLGKYRVEIYVNGRLMNTVKFTVK